jgi:hypothetical protein
MWYLRGALNYEGNRMGEFKYLLLYIRRPLMS